MSSRLCCEVGLNDVTCEFPAALVTAEEPVRTQCFACGQRACRGCSTVRRYLGYGKRRICRDCEEASG